MNEHVEELCEACREKEFDEFRHACVHESIDQNKLFMDKFAIGTWPRWDYDMPTATLTFSRDGQPRVICQMEVVGSTQGKTWEWSWGNANLPNGCKSRMQAVYDFGEQRQWERLTKLFLEHDAYVGWECVSIASHLLGGIGVYRCPDSDGKSDGDLVDAVWVVVLSAAFVN